MLRFFTRFFKEEEGATALEYSLVVGLVSVVIITAVTSVGASLVTVFNDVAKALVPV